MKVAIIPYDGSIETYLALKYFKENFFEIYFLILNAEDENLEKFRLPKNIFSIIKKIIKKTKKLKYIEINKKTELEKIMSFNRSAIDGIIKKISKELQTKKKKIDITLFLNENDFYLNEKEKSKLLNNLPEKFKDMLKIIFFKDIIKKIKLSKELINDTKFYFIRIHKDTLGIKDKKEYKINEIWNKIKNSKFTYMNKTFITYSKSLNFKIKITKIKKINFIDYNIYTPVKYQIKNVCNQK